MHPVQLKAEYVERLGRGSTFFRLILVIPHIIWIYVYGLVAGILWAVAWVATVIMGRNPLWGFLNGFLRYSTRVNAYGNLVTDRFPSFGSGGDYPIDVEVARPASARRLTVFFRGILVLPAAVASTVLGYAGSSAAVAIWLWVVFTGRCPKGLFDISVIVMRFSVRLNAYMLLLTDAYPSVDEPAPGTMTTVA